MTMRRQIMARRVLVTLAVMAVLGVVMWGFLRARIPDPIFEGKPLSYWLDNYKRTQWSGLALFHAEQAVLHAGTNAVPILVRFMKAHDSPLKRRLALWADKQNLVTSPFALAEDRHHEAACGFQALGSRGKSAVPELVHIYERNPSTELQRCVLKALNAIRSDANGAIPMLIAATTNADARCRMLALEALGRMNEQSEVVVPALKNSLNDSNLSRQLHCKALDGWVREPKRRFPHCLHCVRLLHHVPQIS